MELLRHRSSAIVIGLSHEAATRVPERPIRRR